MTSCQPPPTPNPPSSRSCLQPQHSVLVLLLPILLLSSHPPRSSSFHHHRELQHRTLSPRLERRLQEKSRRGNSVPALMDDQSGCSCYRIHSPFGYWQSLCVCHNVCYNGSAILGNFQPYPCVPGRTPQPPSPGQTRSPLRPVKCRRMSTFRKFLEMALKETPVPHGLGVRDTEWRRSRQGIEWRNGTTFVVPLGNPETNIAHFWSKAAQLLLVNSPTPASPSLPYTVDRFMFPRTPSVRQRMSEAGSSGWHTNILHQLALLVTRDKIKGMTPQELQDALGPERLGGETPLLNGTIEFESPWNGATEEQPLCFVRLVFATIIRAVTFPSGPVEAVFFRESCLRDLGIPQDSPRRPMPVPVPAPAPGGASAEGAPVPLGVEGGEEPVRLLFIQRNRTSAVASADAAVMWRRTLLPDSSKALQHLLVDLGFDVTVADFGGMAFREQVSAVQHADIILGLHGAGLINAVLARNTTALLEIFAYRMLHDSFHFSSVNAGLTYFLHQQTQATPQERDAEFAHLSTPECMDSNKSCEEYMIQFRAVEMSQQDLDEIRTLLSFAKQFALKARTGLTTAGNFLREKFNLVCVSRRFNKRCRVNLVRSPLVDPSMDCILNEDCTSPV